MPRARERLRVHRNPHSRIVTTRTPFFDERDGANMD